MLCMVLNVALLTLPHFQPNYDLKKGCMRSDFLYRKKEHSGLGDRQTRLYEKAETMATNDSCKKYKMHHALSC